MEKELKDRWIAALRSGEFRQGRGYLCRYGEYCCLGVLAAITDNLIGLEVNKDVLYIKNSTSFTAVLTSDLRNKFGISKNQEEHLIAMNDGAPSEDGVRQEPLSFEEIADYIENNL